MRDYFNPDWTEYAFGLLWTATWQSVVLVALAGLGLLSSRRAAARSAIWTLCIVALAAAPIISAILPHVFFAYGDDSEPLHFPSTIARPHTASIGPQSFWTFSDGGWSDGMCRTVVYVWLAGVVVALTRLVSGWIQFVRLLGVARPCREPRMQRIVERVVEPAERVTVLELFGLVGAICWQIHRPKIILPGDISRLADVELEMMIRHELAHIRRSDPGLLFIQRLVEILFWFHPLVWWVRLQISKYREFVCDDLVLASGFKPAAYAQCLGHLAVGYNAAPSYEPAGLGMVWSQHIVLERVKRLMHAHRPHTALSVIQCATLFAVAFGFVLVTATARIDPHNTRLTSAVATVRWTAWPPWSANALDAIGIHVRDFPLDAHRYDSGAVKEQPTPSRYDAGK